MMMTMPSLKLSMAASLCVNPSKQLQLFRHITTTPSKISPQPNPATKLPLSASVSTSPCGCTLTPCALLSFSHPAHASPLRPRSNSPLNLSLPFSAFRNRNSISPAELLYPPSTSRSSSNEAGKDPDSAAASSPGSGLVSGMGQDDGKAVNGGWFPSPSMHQRQASDKLLTLPTILTLGRVAAVPLLICTFYVDTWWGRTTTTSIFIAAAITDWLDGYIARKMSLGSMFGAFLDPVADKLMVAATLVLLCTKPLELPTFGHVPWLLTVPAIGIIGREITMSAVREWAASQNTKLLEAVAVNNLGKWKTATQMIALTILLATRDSSIGGPWILVGSGVVLLYVSAGLSLWSLAVYMKKISKVLLK